MCACNSFEMQGGQHAFQQIRIFFFTSYLLLFYFWRAVKIFNHTNLVPGWKGGVFCSCKPMHTECKASVFVLKIKFSYSSASLNRGMTMKTTRLKREKIDARVTSSLLAYNDLRLIDWEGAGWGGA